MVSGVRVPSGLSRTRDVVALAYDPEAEGRKRGDDPRSRSVGGELGAHPATVASATKASRTGESASRASSPND